MSALELLRATDADAVARVTRALDDGALVVLPTDTLYALSADALDEDAALSVFAAKERGADQPLPVCIGGIEDVHHVASLTPEARRLAERFWPGPLTLVLRAKPWVPDAVTSGTGTVAVRVPDHPFARALARHFGPFTVTSANVSGKPAAARVEDAQAQLGGRVRLYVDGGALRGTPSTIVDLTAEPPRILREGALAAAEVGLLGTPGHREL